MRTKLVVGLLVLGLAVSGLGVFGVAAGTLPPPASVNSTVTWTIYRFLRLSIANPNVDFGKITGLADSATKANASTLTIESNINWAISHTITGTASEHVQVSIWQGNRRRARDRATTGTLNATLQVDYGLINLLAMAPGNHAVTVTFTVTPR